MADLFRVAPAGAPLSARAGGWIWVHGVAEEGYSEQFEAGSVWTCNHNLGRYPACVQVRTLGGVVADADIRHVSPNQVRVYFDVPMAGVVECS